MLFQMREMYLCLHNKIRFRVHIHVHRIFRTPGHTLKTTLPNIKTSEKPRSCFLEK
jgi:hypothetical protein